jgi:hypothetical protein
MPEVKTFRCSENRISNLEKQNGNNFGSNEKKLEILHFYKAITKKAGWLVLIGFLNLLIF